MGATLPTLTRYLTADGHLSAAFGRLYAANTIGAIVGTLVAGLVLIELFGLSRGAGGRRRLLGDRRASRALLARAARAVTAAPVPVRGPPRAVATAAGRAPRCAARIARARPGDRLHLGPDVARLPGPVDRLLASGTGNTTYVFTVILALFLVGLAIGALLFNLIRPRIATRPGCWRPPRSSSGRSC